MEIKKAKLILEVKIDNREAKIEFDLSDNETEKVLEILEENS